MKTLYVGFKGIHNSSNKLVRNLQGEKYFLTNSFEGLKRDIENLVGEYEQVYMFGLDKALKDSVRIVLRKMENEFIRKCSYLE